MFTFYWSRVPVLTLLFLPGEFEQNEVPCGCNDDDTINGNLSENFVLRQLDGFIIRSEQLLGSMFTFYWSRVPVLTLLFLPGEFEQNEVPCGCNDDDTINGNLSENFVLRQLDGFIIRSEQCLGSMYTCYWFRVPVLTLLLVTYSV